MKFGLHAAEVWLDSLTSVWKRVLFFWGFLVVSSLIGQKVFGRGFDMETILSLGGATCVLMGPLNYLTLLITPIVWIRLIHLEEGGARSFLLLGVAVALNAGFGQRDYYRDSTPWGLHMCVLVAAWALVLVWAWRRKYRK